jgi:Holliday junction resolvase-like predicted endonuclease
MFWCMVERLISRREQGDIGERSALSWLIDQGAKVYLPFGHSPDVDLIANFGDRLSRVQVKTSTVFRQQRWVISLATRGGNQSWSGLVKYFGADRCDDLFVLVADGRRWFIPAAAVEARAGLLLGGPKYAAFEVEPDRPFSVVSAA